MINTPVTANSIVGFDIDNYIKGDLTDNRAPEISSPVQINQGPNSDVAEISSKQEKDRKGWKVFGGMFVTGIIALVSAPFIKKALKAVKK